MSVIDDDVTDLRHRSMQDNIPIQNFSFTPNEDLATAILMTIKQKLGVITLFTIIHRNGIRLMNNGKPITIMVELTDQCEKDEILKVQRAKQEC